MLMRSKTNRRPKVSDGKPICAPKASTCRCFDYRHSSVLGVLGGQDELGSNQLSHPRKDPAERTRTKARLIETVGVSSASQNLSHAKRCLVRYVDHPVL